MTNPDPNTILFIDDCARKWAPFTEGMTESKAARCAYLLENEAAYLKSLLDVERELKMGASLKFIFPVVRKAVELLPEDETEYPQVYGAFSQAVDDVLEVAESIRSSSEPPTSFESQVLLSPLVERAHDALLKFEKITSR